MVRAAIVLFTGLLLGLACNDGEGGNTCFPGNEGCDCVAGGCLPGLVCVEGTCVPTGAVTTGEETDGDGETDGEVTGLVTMTG